MARPVKESKLDSKEARLRLKPRGQPHFRALEEGFALGYRRNARAAGPWLLRFPAGDKYESETLGKADDFTPSDGESILTYAEAHEKARERVKIIKQRALPNGGKPPTVADAIEAYLAIRKAREIAERGDKSLREDARSRLQKHVIVAAPDLAKKPLHELTAEDLKAWRGDRAKVLGDVKRLISDFRAALNEAAGNYRKQAPNLAEEVRAGFKSAEAKGVVAREHQILTDSDVRTILAATAKIDARGRWDGALLRLVAALAATGARFSQVVRMRVADVQAVRNRLMVPVSAKGKGKKQRTHIAVQVGADVLDLLRPAVAGRRGTDPLFIRPRWLQESVAVWKEISREPWLAASELSRPWGAIIAEAELPADTVPYALRHSSIVRGLIAGLPVRLVAALHDTSSAMIERHYAAYIVDAMDELAARAVVPLITPAPAALRSVK